MKEDIHNFLKVGIVHFMAYPECMGGEGPIVETVARLCADSFFEVVEIGPIKDEAAREKVRALAEQARVELIMGAQPVLLGQGLDLNHADNGERTKAIQAVEGAIDQAAAMDIKSVALLSGTVCDDYEAGKDRLVDSLNSLCAYAAEKGIVVVLETFDQVPYGKNCLIGPTQDAVDIAQRVREKHPSFGLLLDLSHLPLQGEDIREGLEEAKDVLVHAHIGNCAMDDPNHPAYGDNHPRFGAPGTRNDVAELADFLQTLWDIDYLVKSARKTLSFEVKPMAGEDPEAVIAGSKRVLLEAWRKL